MTSDAPKAQLGKVIQIGEGRRRWNGTRRKVGFSGWRAPRPWAHAPRAARRPTRGDAGEGRGRCRAVKQDHGRPPGVR